MSQSQVLLLIVILGIRAIVIISGRVVRVQDFVGHFLSDIFSIIVLLVSFLIIIDFIAVVSLDLLG